MPNLSAIIIGTAGAAGSALWTCYQQIVATGANPIMTQAQLVAHFMNIMTEQLTDTHKKHLGGAPLRHFVDPRNN